MIGNVLVSSESILVHAIIVFLHNYSENVYISSKVFCDVVASRESIRTFGICLKIAEVCVVRLYLCVHVGLPSR